MLNELNKSQLEAVTCPDENVVVIAPPGAGKTKSLVEAICYFREEYLGGKVCAITFTRMAALELEAKLEERHIDNIAISTIHAWSRNLLEDLARKHGFKVRVMEQNQIMRIINLLISNHRTKVKPELLFYYITGNKRMDVPDNVMRTLECLSDKYIQYKRNNDLYDFTDYPYYLLKMLKKYHEAIHGIHGLFVDEFQDVDPIQLELFERVDCYKKFFIGDKKQSIYYFRGADSEIFDKIPDFTVKKLDENYRSYQEILDYADTVYQEHAWKLPTAKGVLISDIMKIDRSPTRCIRGHGAELYVSNVFGQTWNIRGERVDSKLTVNAFLAHEPIILCRTNKQVKAFEAVHYYNVTTIHQAKGLEYDSVILIDELIRDEEDLNVAYVGMTRAKNSLFVGNFGVLLKIIRERHL